MEGVDRPSAAGAAKEDPYQVLEQELEGASAEEALVRVGDALRAHPDDVEIRYWLLDLLWQADRGEQAAEVARDGVALGSTSMILEIARNAPERLTDAEVDSILATEQGPVLAHVLAARGRSDDIERLAEREMRRFESSPSRGSVGTMLDLVLALEAADRPDAARTFLERTTNAIREVRRGASLPEHQKVLLLLVSEVQQVAASLPAPVRRAVIEALRGHGIEQAQPEIESFAREDPPAASSAAKVLEERSAALAAILGPWLRTVSLDAANSRPDPNRRAPPWRDATGGSQGSSSYRWLAIMGALAMMQLVRTLPRHCKGEDASSIPTPVARTSLYDEAMQACAASREICEEALALETMLRADDCSGASQPARTLRDLLRSSGESDARSTLPSATGPTGADARAAADRLLRAHRAACGADGP
jgi:hypothetical protein